MLLFWRGCPLQLYKRLGVLKSGNHVNERVNLGIRKITRKLFTDSGVPNVDSGGQVRTMGVIPTENAGSGSLLPAAPAGSVISEIKLIPLLCGQEQTRPFILYIQNLDRRDHNSTGNSIETSLTSQYNPLE